MIRRFEGHIESRRNKISAIPGNASTSLCIKDLPQRCVSNSSTNTINFQDRYYSTNLNA
ncbi:hypothetical protein WN48_08523 [Eufriesea mexicana]|uniref:Uncharacterized protein n=1 Tax=Eufriesea mexicana TaxID=516756 RepID=A0A310SRQ1_9HYME|nr:hypothetical protein WN48_08523 [Eufriesea mexicana]